MGVRINRAPQNPANRTRALRFFVGVATPPFLCLVLSAPFGACGTAGWAPFFEQLIDKMEYLVNQERRASAVAVVGKGKFETTEDFIRREKKHRETIINETRAFMRNSQRRQDIHRLTIDGFWYNADKKRGEVSLRIPKKISKLINRISVGSAPINITSRSKLWLPVNSLEVADAKEIDEAMAERKMKIDLSPNYSLEEIHDSVDNRTYWLLRISYFNLEVLNSSTGKVYYSHPHEQTKKLQKE